MEWLQEDLMALGLVIFAGALGAIVGLERELSAKPAGLRTHIFVCAGSALFMLLGELVLKNFSDTASTSVSGDPTRVIQAIVTGISFLGAGTIFQQADKRIEGLTTAASIFITAGIGIAVASHHVVLAVGTAVFTFAVLKLVGSWEHEGLETKEQE